MTLFMTRYLDQTTPFQMTAKEVEMAKAGNPTNPEGTLQARGPEATPRRTYTQEQRRELMEYFNSHPELILAECAERMGFSYAAARRVAASSPIQRSRRAI